MQVALRIIIRVHNIFLIVVVLAKINGCDIDCLNFSIEEQYYYADNFIQTLSSWLQFVSYQLWTK